MYAILKSDAAPQYLKQLREWFESEWGHIDPFEGIHPSVQIPQPLIAVDGMRSLAGGLAFSTFPKPDSREVGVWINVLLVAPQHRGKGLASDLIRAAELEAANLDIQELFVQTNISGLYQKLDWRVVQSAGDNIVLSKSL